MRSWFSAALSLLFTACTAVLAQPSGSVEISYEMTRNGSPMADIVERLERSGEDYQLTETWRGRGLFALLGSARRSSQGVVDGAGLRPREFFDERSGRDTARAWFDWKAGLLIMQYKGERSSQPIPPNAQDRLSFLLALSLLPHSGEAVSYTIADGKGLSRHEYRIIGRERLKVPAGDFDTLKVRRGGDDPRESAELWLASERGHLPVRLLVLEKDGTRYDQVATRIHSP
jgi:hypothetical protein